MKRLKVRGLADCSCKESSSYVCGLSDAKVTGAGGRGGALKRGHGGGRGISSVGIGCAAQALFWLSLLIGESASVTQHTQGGMSNSAQSRVRETYWVG